MHVPRFTFIRTLASISASLLVVATLALGSAGASSTSSENVVTYDYNSSRSGDNVGGTAIKSLSAAAVWQSGLDGAVFGEPLIYKGEVIVATEGDSVYALSRFTGRILWRVHVGTPVTTSVIDQATGLSPRCGDINPLGITGTPVISPALNEVFVADETMDGPVAWQNIRHELVAVSMSSHKVLWHRVIDPPGGNTPTGYTIPAQQQRPALTLANGRIYVGLGGLAGDCGLYHGFEVGLPMTGVGTESVYQVPTATEGAIWETNGAVVGPTGDLYVATGNGSSTTTYDGGNSVVELSPSLHELAEWAPSNWATLSQYDADLGSAGPIFVPGTSTLFIAGKPRLGSTGYLLSIGALGTGPSSPLFTGAVCRNGQGDFGANASDVIKSGSSTKTFIYAACWSGVEALSVTGGAHPAFTQAWFPSSGTPIGPPIVSNGEVWSLDWIHRTLEAMNPATGHVDFARVLSVTLNHFATPTVANGYVLIPTRAGVEAFSFTS